MPNPPTPTTEVSSKLFVAALISAMENRRQISVLIDRFCERGLNLDLARWGRTKPAHETKTSTLSMFFHCCRMLQRCPKCLWNCSQGCTLGGRGRRILWEWYYCWTALLTTVDLRDYAWVKSYCECSRWLQ